MQIDLQRREFIAAGTAAMAALTMLHSTRTAMAFPSRPGEVVLPWIDQPAPNPDPVGIQTQLVWEDFEFLDNTERQVLQHLAFRSPDDRCEFLEARSRRIGKDAFEPNSGRHQGAPAAGSHVHR